MCLFAWYILYASFDSNVVVQNTFGEFNEAVSTMRQQKAHTLIGAEALPQTPVDPPLTNSFDFKVASVAGRAKDNETSKLKEEGERKQEREEIDRLQNMQLLLIKFFN